jgi:hypothetical protein
MISDFRKAKNSGVQAWMNPTRLNRSRNQFFGARDFVREKAWQPASAAKNRN